MHRTEIFNIEFSEYRSLIPWMVSRASSLVNEFAVDADGEPREGDAEAVNLSLFEHAITV